MTPTPSSAHTNTSLPTQPPMSILLTGNYIGTPPGLRGAKYMKKKLAVDKFKQIPITAYFKFFHKHRKPFLDSFMDVSTVESDNRTDTNKTDRKWCFKETMSQSRGDGYMKHPNKLNEDNGSLFTPVIDLTHNEDYNHGQLIPDAHKNAVTPKYFEGDEHYSCDNDMGIADSVQNYYDNDNDWHLDDEMSASKYSTKLNEDNGSLLTSVVDLTNSEDSNSGQLISQVHKSAFTPQLFERSLLL